MTVRADKAPTIPTMLAAIDTGARNAASAARVAAVPIVRACIPVVTGRARQGTVGRISRTPTGYRLVIDGSSRVRYPSGVTARQVLGWIHRGTGIYGTRGTPITPRKAQVFRLPHGWEAASVRGQRGHNYFAAGEAAADPIVLRAFEAGAAAAARLVEATL